LLAFSTSIGDLSFGARFLSRDQPPEIVIANARVPSDVEPISGTFKATRDGTLVLVFDNSFSWFNSKLLSYRVELYQV
jgi:hypothetical protein